MRDISLFFASYDTYWDSLQKFIFTLMVENVDENQKHGERQKDQIRFCPMIAKEDRAGDKHLSVQPLLMASGTPSALVPLQFYKSPTIHDAQSRSPPSKRPSIRRHSCRTRRAPLSDSKTWHPKQQRRHGNSQQCSSLTWPDPPRAPSPQLAHAQFHSTNKFQTSSIQSELRIYVWLILLNAPPVQTNVYLDLVGQGPSPAYSKIRNDTFRTLATDPLFRRRVTENSLTRVLNAVAWKLHDAHEARVNGWQSPPTLEMGGGARHHTFPLPPPREASLADTTGTTEDDSEIDVHPITTSTTAATTTTDALPPPATPPDQPSYVQGMNVLAAPFLYAARSETEAFAAFSVLVTRECPGYVRGSMEGVHRGLALVDKILAVVEPRLAAHLVAKGLNAEIYAFASVLTMCACTPPLPEVLRLWDFLFAYGCHLNLVCVVAQLVMIKDQLLSSSRSVG